MGGTGKSTFAYNYGHQKEAEKVKVRLLKAEDGLEDDFESLAADLEINFIKQ
jgi:hypothetical protein